MIIKAETEKDYAIIESLAREIWTEHYTPIIGREQVDYMLEKFQSTEAIINQIKNEKYLYYLIKDDEKYVGYIGIQVKENGLFLSKFYVKSSERGKGHGKQSLLFIENLAKERKLNRIFLTVNKNNSNTINAYEKMGFRKTNSIVQDIGNGFIMDDYVMQLIVDS